MEEVLFKYKGKVFSERPRGTYCYVEYIQDGVRFIELRKVNQAPFILLMVITVIFVVMAFSNTSSTCQVQSISKVQAKDSVIQLNLKNDSTNKCAIDIKLMHGNEVLCAIENLEPGSEIGNIRSRKILKPGSYMCKLTYSIPNKQVRSQYTSDVLLIVE